MPITVISATPSPYARKVRIALTEKGIPFTLQTEVPWDSTTATPKHNPLEKLPVLIDDSTSPPASVYESHFILEWLEANYGPKQGYKAIYPADKADELLAKQMQVVADGICDACVLMFFEKQRPSPSPEWSARQLRKIHGGLKALNAWVTSSSSSSSSSSSTTPSGPTPAPFKPFIINNTFSLADVAAGAVLGYMKVRFPDQDWQTEYPALKQYSDGLEERESFRATAPVPQVIGDKIV